MTDDRKRRGRERDEELAREAQQKRDEQALSQQELVRASGEGMGPKKDE